MTEEKKKRGRPRKIESFKALKEEMDVAARYQPSNLEKMVEVLQDVELTKKAIADLKKTSSPEPPYPSNWNELGKIAKLQWLTANRK